MKEENLSAISNIHKDNTRKRGRLSVTWQNVQKQTLHLHQPLASARTRCLGEDYIWFVFNLAFVPTTCAIFSCI